MLVVGDAAYAVIAPHIPEELRTVSLSVEDENEPGKMRIGIELFLTRLSRDIFKQAWHDLFTQNFDHAGVDDLVDDEEGTTDRIIDPVIVDPA